MFKNFSRSICCNSSVCGGLTNNLSSGRLTNSLASGGLNSNTYKKSNAWGIMTSIDIKNCNPHSIRDADYIKKYVEDLCKLIKMNRFGPCNVVFFGEDAKVAGYSMVQLIETSLISGHFANINNSAYIDIFSCKYYNPDIAAKFTADYFESKKYTKNVILRK